jgi:hypothetical protein
MRYPTRAYQSDRTSLPLGRSDDRVNKKGPPLKEEQARRARTTKKSTGSLTPVFPYQKSTCMLSFAKRADRTDVGTIQLPFGMNAWL